MHDERYMNLEAERDGSGFAGGRKGFAEREPFFLSSTFLGLVSVTLLLGGRFVSSIFITLHFVMYRQAFCFCVHAYVMGDNFKGNNVLVRCST